MDKLNFTSKKTIFLIGFFTYFTATSAALLIPFTSFFMSVEGYAAPKGKSPLSGARVVNADGLVLLKKSGSSRSKPVDQSGHTEEGVAELRNSNDVLTVDGDNWSKASFVSIPPGMQAYTRPQPDPTEYTFPCRANLGNLVLGWVKGKSRGCAPPGITLTSGKNFKAQLLEPVKIAQVINQHLIAQPSLEQLKFQYCSVAAKGQGWWTRWGTLDGSYDPCEEATQQCLQDSSEGECTVVSMGEWKATDRDLLVSVECADNRVLKASSGGVTAARSLVRELVLEAKFDRNKLCGLNIYHPNDVIVAPASEKATLIQAFGLNNSLTIDALAGDVIIRSAKKPGGITLKVGHRYIYPEDKIQPINIKEMIDSPLVSTFLDPTNWPQDVSKQIQAYQSSPEPAEPPKPAEPPAADRNTANDQTGVILNTLWNLWNMVPRQPRTDRARPTPETSTPQSTDSLPPVETPISPSTYSFPSPEPQSIPPSNESSPDTPIIPR
jgi:hypothetical protein